MNRECNCGLQGAHYCLLNDNEYVEVSRDGFRSTRTGKIVEACSAKKNEVHVTAEQKGFIVPPEVLAKYAKTQMLALSDAQQNMYQGWELIATLPTTMRTISQYPESDGHYGYRTEVACLVGITADKYKKQEELNEKQAQEYKQSNYAKFSKLVIDHDNLKQELESVKKDSVAFKRAWEELKTGNATMQRDLKQYKDDLERATNNLKTIRAAIGELQYNKILGAK